MQGTSRPKPDPLFTFFLDRSPTVLCKYPNTITAKVLNFNCTMSNTDVDDFIKSPPSCDCASSYRYEPRHHVITEDFNIISNKDLRQLLLKGVPTIENNQFGNLINFHFHEDYAKQWAFK